MSRFRGWIQAAATLLTNIHLPNFFKGGIYQGKGKTVCVPGLNCYSCPAASGACPIGAFQAVVGSSKFRFSYYITGILILLGVLLGRFICGFLCPFGWLQELLHKIPGKKLSTKKLRPLTYLKYVILLLAVVLLPALIVNDVGMGDPYFCKYICPQGVLEGAIPLAAANESIRAALGALFTRKLIILIAVVVLSVLFFRPFCKWICPLGAFLRADEQSHPLRLRPHRKIRSTTIQGRHKTATLLLTRSRAIRRSTRASASPAANARAPARWTWTSPSPPTTRSASAAASASAPAPRRPSASAMASASPENPPTAIRR